MERMWKDAVVTYLTYNRGILLHVQTNTINGPSCIVGPTVEIETGHTPQHNSRGVTACVSCLSSSQQQMHVSVKTVLFNEGLEERAPQNGR